MDLGLWIEQGLEAGGTVAMPFAFAGGVVMGLNPCCVALYPVAAASCCAGACLEPQRPAASRALLFVLGTAAATTILGMIAALAGEAMTAPDGWVAIAVAIVPIVTGTVLLGGSRLRMPLRVSRWTQQGLPGAFVSGLLLSLVMSPCGTPALAAILTFAAYKGDLAFGALLLFAYGLGNGLPVLVVGTAAGAATKRLQLLGWTTWLNRAAGIAMVGVGAYLLLAAIGRLLMHSGVMLSIE